MKTSAIVIALVSLTVSLTFANPTMLPKHPGYPMGKAVDPVTGQSLANDPGQANAGGREALNNAALVDDSRSKQDLLFNQNDERLLEKPGAGLLPKVEGPNITIEPPVKEGTKVSAAPE
ncbi:MAG: hypothetical protein OJF50_001597 [Nitrospira sp.]|jgi:hypothetical protein|nr:hypothetical protein [Nitrospira sp.]MDI3462776.1 hypothetical protein [Nitrospira sp.]